MTGERTRFGSFWRNPPPHEPTFKSLEGVVSSRILSAMRVASGKMKMDGVPHMLVGGLAVSLYGIPRATGDVDFVVGPQGYRRFESGIVMPLVPIRVDDVIVDPIFPADDERHLFTALEHPIYVDGIPVAPINALIYMKLSSPRLKDSADVVGLLQAGVDQEAVREYLLEFAPHLILKFRHLVHRIGE